MIRSITKPGECMFAGSIHWNTFLSIEPLLEPLDVGIGSIKHEYNKTRPYRHGGKRI
ncbi:MAG TPA: hypothetical protein PLY59_07540 [Clostridiales bacterium]|nr:hypothetical protein [Clostridiales bacterium]